VTCPHDLAERETAVADGHCPLCPHPDVARLDALDRFLQNTYYIDIGMNDDEYVAISADRQHALTAKSLRELGDLCMSYEKAQACPKHDWIDITNDVITNGWMCRLCGVLKR
jgi:hypothetical protein